MSIGKGIMWQTTLQVFTDGSCDPIFGMGGWAALIILDEGEKIFLSGKASETTHQRMELTAAVEALTHIQKARFCGQEIFLNTDSQYLAGLPRRKAYLLRAGFRTKGNKPLPNADLIVQIFRFLEMFALRFVRTPSHQKKNGREDYNREADKCSRKIVRESVRNRNRKARP